MRFTINSNAAMKKMQDTFPAILNPSSMYPASILHWPPQVIEITRRPKTIEKSVIAILYPSCIRSAAGLIVRRRCGL